MIAILKRRPEFLRIRGGGRWATPRLVVEAKARTEPLDGSEARFGFTVTKQIGKAVVRNRIRRRLREAVRKTNGSLANFDYVLIARALALDCDFEDLIRDIEAAFNRVHRPPKPKSRGGAT